MEIRNENLETFFNLYRVFGFQNSCTFEILRVWPGFVQDRVNFLTVAVRGQSLEPCGSAQVVIQYHSLMAGGQR